MFEAISSHDTFQVIDRKQLVKLKIKAMRSGAWFKALKRIDRALIDLTIQVTDTIRSAKLAKSLLMLTKKLEGVMESRISRLTREVGLPLARKISLTAQRLGNISAKSWAFDPTFALFLAALQLNNSGKMRT